MADILLKGKDGISTNYDGVEELRVPIDSTTKQSYFAIPSLKVYFYKPNGDGSVNILAEITKQPLLCIAGNYSIRTGLNTKWMEENGTLNEEGTAYSMGILVTNKTLTPGNNYTYEYLKNTR